MGTWSSSLYGNDTTCDVRDTYIGFLEDGLSNDEAYEKTLDAMKETLEDDEAPLFWYALAETQWKVGRLRPEVRENALEWIEKGGGMEPWLETKSKGSGWQKTLDKLKEKLNSPMGKEKKIRKPAPLNENPWELNDVYAYQFPEGKPECAHLAGKYIAMQKIGEAERITGVKMRVLVFRKIFDSLPSLEELKEIHPLPLSRRCKGTLLTSRLFTLGCARDYPKKQLTFIGNQPSFWDVIGKAPLEASHPLAWCYELGWWHVYEWFPEYYEAWPDGSYEYAGDGIYKSVDDK